MSNAIVSVPAPVNEPVRSYAPGSPERASLKQRLDALLAEPIEIPIVIGGKEVRTGDLGKAVCPHDHEQAAGPVYCTSMAILALAVKHHFLPIYQR